MGWVAVAVRSKSMLVDFATVEQNTGMSLPEQPDYSAEQEMRPPSRLVRLLNAERDLEGSTSNYIAEISARYESDDTHKVNMQQLRRMANFVTNPNKSEVFSSRFTDAFYKGQVLGYRVGDDIVGEEWPSTAYKVFNENMRSHLATYRDMSMSQVENLQQMANALIALLARPEDSSIPVFLDEMILEWVDQTSDDLAEQSYTIMGFRHIVRQLSGTDVVRMEVGNKFAKLMDRNQIDDMAAGEIVSLDAVRDQMMELYADHRVKFGDFDENDVAKATELVHYLNIHMNQELLAMRELAVGDDITVTGGAMYHVLDNNSTSVSAYLLNPTQTLKGTVDSIAIKAVMTNESIPTIRQYEIDPEADTSRTVVNPFGVMLLLRDPLINQGNHVIFPPVDCGAVGLVMNNPNMTISKYR